MSDAPDRDDVMETEDGDSLPDSFAEAMEEIRRLRRENAELRAKETGYVPSDW